MDSPEQMMKNFEQQMTEFLISSGLKLADFQELNRLNLQRLIKLENEGVDERTRYMHQELHGNHDQQLTDAMKAFEKSTAMLHIAKVFFTQEI